MVSRLDVYHSMNALRLCRPRMVGTRFIRPALFWRTMFEGGPTLGEENDSTLGEKAKSAPVEKGENFNQGAWGSLLPYRHDGCC